MDSIATPPDDVMTEGNERQHGSAPAEFSDAPDARDGEQTPQAAATASSDAAPTSANGTSTPAPVDAPLLVIRGGVGGVLMGLANLVPGISGGTMLVAAGVYPRFINAIAEVTTFRFRRESLIVLGSVVVAAALAILFLAGAVKTLVVEQRWIMYSLFIGLTLGGVPIVWRMIDRNTRGVWLGLAAGFAVMALIAWFQGRGSGGGESAEEAGFVLLLLAGVAGASAMILPGVSGGYLLLVLGVYVPILAGIDAFKEALKAREMDAVMDVGANLILPVGLGVVIGIVVVSNVLRTMLNRFERPTLGVLLGLLFGAVVGLWPFQHGVPPQVGATFKGDTVARNEAGELVMQTTGKVIDADKFPTDFFTPTGGQVLGSLGLIAVGFAVTMLVARLGREKEA